VVRQSIKVKGCVGAELLTSQQLEKEREKEREGEKERKREKERLEPAPKGKPSRDLLPPARPQTSIPSQ
jgi:hypothetical protein